jgi:two-component system, cell cycle response regulator
MRILIADDSIVSRHLLEATLRKWGYEVEVTCDGLEAWNALQSEGSPRMAILDWVMPGLSGPEVCKRVRDQAAGKESNYTYLLLLSSKSQKEDLIEGMESGADDYLTKPFDQHELKVRLRAGGRIIDLEGELVRTREELREQATKDFLTRIWNRSSILDIFNREMNRTHRERRPLGIVMADIDRFKSINDSFGHQAGDTVLKEFARRMLGCMRPYDAIGRYGGEEFLVVLPGCSREGAMTQAERMRAALANEPILIGDSQHSATSSFGVTTWEPGIAAEPDALIRAADDALYAAKHRGRNRVVFFPEN